MKNEQLNILKQKFETQANSDVLIRQFKHKTTAFFTPSSNNIIVSFEQTDYDIDFIEAAINTHNGVKKSLILSRAISGTPQEIKNAVEQMHDNIRKIEFKYFNPSFAKDIEKYHEDLLSIYFLFNSP